MKQTIIQAARAALLGALVVMPTVALGQSSLDRRITSASSDGRVQFTFPARAGVCGNGRSYIQTGPNSFTGNFNGNMSDQLRSDPCVSGPVRVVGDGAGPHTVPA